MRRKRMRLMAVLMAILMLLPVQSVQAATSYVMGDSVPGVITAGSYQVKLSGNKLYSRRGKSGGWKKIASPGTSISCFTTNGSTVYYVTSNYSYLTSGGKSQIYSVSVKGGSAKRVVTINNKGVSNIYRYSDKLYLTECYGKNGRDLYSYSLSNKKHRKMSSGRVLYDAWQGYGIVTDGRYYKWATPLYSMKLSTGQTRKLTSYSYGHVTSGNYVYYISYFRGISAYRQSGSFVIKRATVSGNNIKTLTKTLVGTNPSISGNYVVYDYNGRTRKVRFK